MRGPQSFSSHEPENPCDYGRRVWDERVGSCVKQNHSLRVLTVCLSAAIIVLSAGFVYQTQKSTVEPFIVEVDSTTGAVKNAGVISELKYTPQDIEMEYFIGEFIRNTRTLPLDADVYKLNWYKAYGYMTRDAATKMNSIVESEGVAKDFQKKTVQVTIHSILPVSGSQSTYQANWTEEVFENGRKLQSNQMTGNFMTTLIPGKDKETLLLNPLGIYIKDFNWSRDNVGNDDKK